jgi:hypothetical protein
MVGSNQQARGYSQVAGVARLVSVYNPYHDLTSPPPITYHHPFFMILRIVCHKYQIHVAMSRLYLLIV